MILSLLKVVCIALVGVGVHTPTPTLIKEDTKPQENTITINENNIKIEPQKASGDESQSTYNQDLTYTTRNYYHIGEWEQRDTWYANYNRYRYLNTGAYYEGSTNTNPYNVTYIARENKISTYDYVGAQEPPQYGFSVGTFNDNWNVYMNAVRIDTNKATQNATLSFYNEFRWRVENRFTQPFNQKYIMWIETYIGYGDNGQKVWNYAYSHESNNEIHNYINQQIATWQKITERVEQEVYIANGDLQYNDYSSNTFGFVLDKSYQPNILATAPTYVMQFIRIACENGPNTANTDYYCQYVNCLRNDQEIIPPPVASNSQDNEIYGTIGTQLDGTNNLQSIWTNANITTEVIDVPGMMFEILTMPFTFISTAFNLTLFPGTRYQINVSNLMLTIFGILVFIFILKMVLKK